MQQIIYRTNEKLEPVEHLMHDLSSPDGKTIAAARKGLAAHQHEATPALMHALFSPDTHLRLEAAHVLAIIKDPAAAESLVLAMLDEDPGVRWAAAESLSALDRAAIRPLMLGIMAHFESPWLRNAAHHVLHRLMDRGRLTASEKEVYQALDEGGPGIQAAWKAEAVYEEMLESQTAPKDLEI